MLGSRADWHKLIIRPKNELYTDWFHISEWLKLHCEGNYLYTTNIIKFQLESDLILFQLGYRDKCIS